MQLIVGLGNPSKYKNTRHNIGKKIIKNFAKELYFPKFKNNKMFLAKTAKKDNLILALPNTFVNNSGQAVKKLSHQFIKNSLKNLWIVHDDIDLPLGIIRISYNSSSGGHNGVKSIINHLKTKEFIRFRIGIKNKDLEKVPAKNFVLEKFKKQEKETLKQTIKKTNQALKLGLEKGIEAAMQNYN